MLCILMFIGASPGSTGGGIKTSTFFVLIQAVRSMYTTGSVHTFHRSISRQNIFKACMITLALGSCCLRGDLPHVYSGTGLHLYAADL